MEFFSTIKKAVAVFLAQFSGKKEVAPVIKKQAPKKKAAKPKSKKA